MFPFINSRISMLSCTTYPTQQITNAKGMLESKLIDNGIQYNMPKNITENVTNKQQAIAIDKFLFLQWYCFSNSGLIIKCELQKQTASIGLANSQPQNAIKPVTSKYCHNSTFMNFFNFALKSILLFDWFFKVFNGFFPFN